MNDKVRAALDAAWKVGMHQHASEIERFAELVDSYEPRHVIEIGSLHGGTATLLHGLCSGTVVSVDLPTGRFGGADHHIDGPARAKRLMDALPRYVPIDANSQNAETVKAVRVALRGELADVLLIDGDHTFQGVVTDFALYAPLVRHHGIIAFHDIADTVFHQNEGVQVSAFWSAVMKVSPGARQFIAQNEVWGGIGVVFKC